MKRFSTIETCIWGDPIFLGLSDRAKLVYLFLMTHPHMESFGGMRATAQGLAAELNWPVGRFRKACLELEEKKCLYRSDTAFLYWVPTYLHFNLPRTVEDMADLVRTLALSALCPLKQEIIVRVGDLLKTGSDELYGYYRDFFAKQLLRDPPPTPPPAPAEAKPEPKMDIEARTQRALKTVADLFTLPDPELGPPPKLRVEDIEDPEFVAALLQSRIPPRQVPIPPPLNRPAFREAWNKWLTHLEAHDWMLTRSGLEMQLNRLALLSPEEAAEDIEFSIAHGFRMVMQAEDDWAANEPEFLSPASAEA